MCPDSSVPCLDAADQVFHEAYDEARADAELQAPLLIVLADELALHVRRERRSFPFSHPPFHTAKVAAHVAVALYSLTGDAGSDEMAPETVLRLESIRAHVKSAIDRLNDATAEEEKEEEGKNELEREIVSLLQSSLEYAQRALSEHAGRASGRDDFARASGPIILRATESATCGQIAALHGAFERVLSELSALERAAMQVVVVGDHQARSRSLGMQYFQRRFGESEGADDRVTYGENVADEAEAIALVGTRRLDCAIARAFFADEKRLQRDVLGDAAKKCLDGMRLAPIDSSEPDYRRREPG
ncbi:MAG: hypothetical protein WDO69_04315 [Pseudomonadota bacterium]